MLRYLLDLDTAATAEWLGIAPGTVRSTLHHALAALRVHLTRRRRADDHRPRRGPALRLAPTSHLCPARDRTCSLAATGSGNGGTPSGSAAAALCLAVAGGAAWLAAPSDSSSTTVTDRRSPRPAVAAADLTDARSRW